MAFRLEGYHQGEYGSESLKEACLLVFSFLCGAYACGLLIDKNQVHFGGKAFYGLALVLNSSLLASAAFIPGRLLPVCPVAAACGLQNAMCTSHFGAIIRTTHVSCLLYTSSCSESPVARWQRSYVFRYEVAQMFNWAVAIARCLVARKFKKQEKPKKEEKITKSKKKKKKN